MANRVNHQDVVKRALESKAIDFAAIGKTFAELGPALAVADEPWEGFCGTMRRFVHIYILNEGNIGDTVENLAGLRALANEIKGG